MKKSSASLPVHPKKKKLNLALQGGGSHGAFTWGVLDRLLDEKRLEIEGIVGTSAGAVNATILAYGLAAGGPAKAKELLNRFWMTNSKNSRCSPFQPTVFDKLMGSKGSIEFSPYWQMFDILSRMFSPYQWNPNNKNAFKEMPKVDRLFRAAEVAQHSAFHLRHNVLTGRLEVLKIAKSRRT